MKNDKHTPGPWIAVDDQRGSWLVKDVDDITVAGTFSRMDDGHEQANARLIAAAPELLAALESLLIAATGYRRSNEIARNLPDVEGPVERKARAALARAKG